MVTTRFVILHHRQRSGEHWDLLIEQPEALAAWRLARLPLPTDPTPIPAERLPDHRKLYLQYEGPLREDRGNVSRVDAGACEILEQSGGSWRVRLQGQRVAGIFVLNRQSEGGVPDLTTKSASPAGNTAPDSWTFASA